jgi:hydroxyethylthiazole kinase-like uncharacterized protein yjeF
VTVGRNWQDRVVTPVVTVEEMRAIDAAAVVPTPVLVERAGWAVARAALELMGGGYGRRVLVLAGPGNNGADGRVAARRLRRRGVTAEVIDVADAPASLPPADLVIDAAFGTGLTREYVAPDPGRSPVLAVDIPSGIDGDTGALLGRPMTATRTVTFAAWKAGLLLGAGPAHAGDVEVVDIGLDVSRATVHVLDDEAVAAMLPARPRDAHKWNAAVLVVAGSTGMTGAAAMAAAAAQRAGAGMVQLAVPGVPGGIGPVEAVSLAVDESRWAAQLLDDEVVDLDRSGAAVVGPGLGTSMATRHQIRRFVADAPLPLVVDGDGLTALGGDAATVLAGRRAATVLTPHDGELARLTGAGPAEDRIGLVRRLASSTGSVVLAKGPTTVVAEPGGAVRLVTTGDARLATAGTGDVLSGIIAALLAGGLDGFDAASSGAHLHGTAGRLGPAPGTIATDVIAALPAAMRLVQRGAS